MRTAFVRDFNLWVRDVKTRQETQLTTDGVKDFAYATNDAGWTRSDTPVVDSQPTLDAVRGFGDAVTHVLQSDTPTRLLT